VKIEPKSPSTSAVAGTKRKLGDTSTPTPEEKKVTVQVGNREDDIKKVFVKMLPPDVTETELQQLSPDIRSVQLKSKIIKYKKGKQLIKKTLPFAILEFDNEKMAEKNLAKLKGKEIRTYKIEVDFVGEKSSQEKKSRSTY